MPRLLVPLNWMDGWKDRAYKLNKTRRWSVWNDSSESNYICNNSNMAIWNRRRKKMYTRYTILTNEWATTSSTNITTKQQHGWFVLWKSVVWHLSKQQINFSSRQGWNKQPEKKTKCAVLSYEWQQFANKRAIVFIYQLWASLLIILNQFSTENTLFMNIFCEFCWQCPRLV